jgi:hypothetical protein
VPGRVWTRQVAGIVVSVLTATVFWGSPTAQAPRQLYASPAGSASNDGSLARPLDLDTALSSQGPVRPGDTVWLRGGVYRRQAGPAYNGVTALYVSTLNGTAAAPVIVRQYPGERATLDGNLAPSLPVLVVDGSYTWFWGFEITNSNPNRSSTRGAGIDSYGHHNRFVNLSIHDTGQGVGFWASSQADDSEVYGSIISHVGWEGGDRGHGHSLYVQNVNGTKKITDNIMFEGFSFGIHAYTENGGINNLAVTGNIVFNHGNISATGGPKANILFAGGRVAQNPTVVGNFGYFPAASVGRSLDVSECNSGALQNNYLAGGTPLRIGACTNTVVSGNTLYGPVAASTQAAYPSNLYSTTPSGVFVGIRPNAYEAGRANIAIFNWARHSSVPVDVAAILPVGTPYQVRDAQNFFGPPVATGVYSGGPITIPMTGLTAAPVIGTAPVPAMHTGPEFGAFVLVALGAPTTPPPPAAPRIDAVSPAASSAAGGVTVTLTGAGFAPGATVQIGGVAATAVVVPNSSTVSFIAPPHAPGPVDIVVTSSGLQAVRTAAFRYDPARPALDPATVSGSQVALHWRAGPGTPVRGYGVVAGRSPGGSDFGPFLAGQATTMAATAPPGMYHVRVLADTPWGILTSNEIAFAVGLEAVPAAPALAPATVAGRTVTLSWTAGAGNPTGYVVVARYLATGPPIATLPVTNTRLTVAAPPGVYLVSVVALNAAGVGLESNQIVVAVT